MLVQKKYQGCSKSYNPLNRTKVKKDGDRDRHGSRGSEAWTTWEDPKPLCTCVEVFPFDWPEEEFH